MNKILTISIAAYNVQKTIEKCLDSFLPCRCFDKLEILVINDGSTDKTQEIVSNYQIRYPNTIRLVNKENGGHGSTLNKSLSLARGKYYKAVDGDDWVIASELDKLVNELERTNADLIIDDYNEVYPDHKKLISLRKNHVLGKIYQFDDLFYDKKYEDAIFVLSNSTIKTDRLRSVKMKVQEHCFYADTELYFYIGLATRTVMFINSCVYQYRLGNAEQSVSENGIYKHIGDLIKIENNLIRLYEKVVPQIKSQVRREYLFSIIDTRLSMLFDCYTKIIQKDDKDRLFASFLFNINNEHPIVVKRCKLSYINRYILAKPQKRIQQVRHFRKSQLFKILHSLKHLKD